MTRILFWVALICLIIAALRSKFKNVSAPPQQQRKAEPKAAEQGKIEAMLCCAHCGVYYPASETVQADGRDFCSPAHARLPVS